jgi:hypothetical protein
MKTIIEILIDNSRSMGPFQVESNNGAYLLPDKSTRMSLARSILKSEFIPTFDYASKIALRTFHSNDKKNNELVIDTLYDTHFDVSSLQERIDEIADPIDTGGTPITEALTYSIKKLANYEDYDRKIILVTDGEETGDGDYRKAANDALTLYGIPCNIFVVGIALTESAEVKAKMLAFDTKGEYVSLKSKVYTKESLDKILRPFKTAVISKSIENTLAPIEVKKSSVQKIATPSVAKPSSLVVESKEEIIDKEPSNENGSIDISNLSDETKKNEDRKTDSTLDSDQFNKLDTKIDKNNSVISLMSKQLVSINKELTDIKTSINKASEDKSEMLSVEENSELNERVRLASESFLNSQLEEKYGDRLNWLNKEGESGESYDFEVLDTFDDTTEYYIECKGSMNHVKVFYMTKSEWALFLDNTKNYQLYFISNALSNPQITKIDNFKEWLMTGKVVPYLNNNFGLKAQRIPFTILK